MNAPTGALARADLRTWQEDQAFAWRGRCLDLFSKAEADIDRALRDLDLIAGDSWRPPADRLARLDGLPLERQGSKRQQDAMARARDDWARAYQMRSVLAHGVQTLLTAEPSGWRVRLRSVDGRNEIIDSEYAAEFESELKIIRQRLQTQLSQLRDRLTSQRP